jgi:hypothetical protein
VAVCGGDRGDCVCDDQPVLLGGWGDGGPAGRRCSLTVTLRRMLLPYGPLLPWKFQIF